MTFLTVSYLFQRFVKQTIKVHLSIFDKMLKPSRLLRKNGSCIFLFQGCSAAADLVFIIDGSGSIRHERFQDIKDFVIGIVEELEINPNRPNKVKVAAICFDTEAFVEFYLNTYQTKQDIIQGIQRIHYLGGRTNIADAFRRMRRDVFLPSRGDWEGVPNFAIVFSDGASNVDETETLPEAIAARVEGAHIITVGVGYTLNIPVLQGMTSDPYQENLFTVESFNNLKGLIPNIIGATCDGKLMQTSIKYSISARQNL